jgi:hypothetical protein
MNTQLEQLSQRYLQDGFVNGVRVVSGTEAAMHREALESAESTIGSLHYNTKVLFQGQTVLGVDESKSIMCPLKPGEASFHHGWTLHSSMPNKSNERRIGLNVQYFAAHVRQTKHEQDSALLVRGHDKFMHFIPDIPAASNLDAEALKYQAQLEARYQEIAGNI